MAGPETRELLKGSSILRCLSERQLETLELHIRNVHYPANKTVFRKGDPGDTMMIVVSGRMKITTTSMDGSEMIINTILPGEVVGEIALLDGQERTADAVTAEETEALVIRRDDFALLLKDSADLCLSVIDLLCDKLRRSTELAEESVFLELSERLFKRLQTYAEASSSADSAGELRIDHGLSQQGLADELGVTRESVNRQLAEWRDMGLVKVGRGYVVVSDMDALEDAVL